MTAAIEMDSTETDDGWSHRHPGARLEASQARYRRLLRCWAAHSDQLSLAGIDALLDMVRALHQSTDPETLHSRMVDVTARMAVSDTWVLAIRVADWTDDHA